jgi:alkylation response protein AidB-like acyl-CoA dehydrogenase
VCLIEIIGRRPKVDFNFTEKQNALREKVREYVDTNITPAVVREIEEKDEFPHDLVKKFCDLGLAKVNIPEAYGGLGGDIVDLMIVFEEIAKKLPVLCWNLGNILLYGNEIISVNGNQEQKDEFLPKLARGEIMFCFAITEPNAGSDAASIKTKAFFDNGYYVINGGKMFITGAGVSNYAVTFTRTAESKYGGITSFIVDTSLEGYSAKSIKKLAFHGSNTCEVVYDNVRVLPRFILGGEEKGLNNGWKQEMKLLNQERLVLSSMTLGMAQASFDEALSFAREKMKRTSPSTEVQSIQHDIAEMASELEAMKVLAYSTAWKEAKGLNPVRETSMTKYFCAETAKSIIMKGMNVLGENAASTDYNMQRNLREILIFSIGGGTSQIQKNIICKTYGL